MINKLKETLIGPPLPTQQLLHQQINKLRALAAFSPDALSSIAYANQEIYLTLLVAGSAGLAFSWPIGLVITGLLVIVALSYYQTIHGYPTGGGSYVVARDNLGTIAGLVAAAALLIDYILTAAVSLTAGVDAIASAIPDIWPHRVSLALFLLLLITLANLRGLRETGTLLTIPVYFFLLAFFFMLAFGVIKVWQTGPVLEAVGIPEATHPLTWFLVLRAFATGCTALTGIEAISNGVPSFKPPEAKNAGRTLIVMAILMGALFIGSIGLTHFMGVVAAPRETILSALARRLLGNGAGYYIIQISTLLILAVAANTSFAGFPRLAAIVAEDGFLPRQLTGLGDRLVFANGIALLSIASGVLIVLFGGDTHALIPLFAVGVFLAFSLSQIGMVRHWVRVRGTGWWWKAFINALGALATFVTLVVVALGKFVEGAWITVFLIPLFVYIFLSIRSHYQEVRRELSMRGLPPSLRPAPTPRVVIPVSGVHRGIVDAINFSRSITNDITAVYVELDPGSGQRMRKTWEKWWPDIPLVILPSPYRSIVGPLIKFLDESDLNHHDGQLATLVLPEFVPAKWWHSLLHNQSAWLLKAAMLYRRRNLGYTRAIIDIPYHLRK